MPAQGHAPHLHILREHGLEQFPVLVQQHLRVKARRAHEVAISRRVIPEHCLELEQDLQRRRRQHRMMEVAMCEFPQLAERIGHFGGELSGGEQQRLAVGRALMANPSLVLMDEPSEGLSPRLVLQVGAMMKRLREHGLAVMLVEQNLSLALSVADYLYVLASGRFVFEGTPEQLSRKPAILDEHLGVSRRRI